MFEKITKKQVSGKQNKQNDQKKALSEFSFFSKLSKFKPDDVLKLADSFYEETEQANKAEKAAQLRVILENSAVADLIKYMKSDNEIARSIAAQIFADSESPNLFSCIDAMLTDESENLRISCMEALTFIESPLTITLLNKGMRDESAKVRMKAAIGIADLAQLFNNKEAIHILNNNIADPDPEIRQLILDELGLIGNESTVKELFKAMESFDEDEKELANESLSLLLSKTL